jgi:hypothetical protein
MPDFSGRPLHHEPVSFTLKREINIDSILDLFTLAIARKVMSSNINSGFGRLARNLTNTISITSFEKISFRLAIFLSLKNINSN